MSQSASGASRVDVQFHFIPSFYADLLKEHGHRGSAIGWCVESALDYMDSYGVGVGMMSITAPSTDFLRAHESVGLARRLNEFAAEVAAENPGRFGNFATLPMLDVAASLEEIAYCLDTLRMDGVCVMSNCEGLYLGHERFAPVFDELNRRQAVVFVHPTDPTYKGTLNVAEVAEWPFDTARTAIDLMYSGTVRRCPDVRFILAHAGGALPMILTRVKAFARMKSSAGFNAKGGAPITDADIGAAAASFYYDLALSAGENAIGALRGVTDMEHVLFASDWPYGWEAAGKSNVANFEALGLAEDERHAIERGNAARLFPQLSGA